MNFVNYLAAFQHVSRSSKKTWKRKGTACPPSAEKIILLNILVFRFQGQVLRTTAQEENPFQ